jgi:cysteinyl-tRNA synthetase
MPLFKSDGLATSRVLNASPHRTLRRLSMALGFAMSMSACGGGGNASAAHTPTGLEQVAQRGFPVAGPWVSFYGGAHAVDLEKMSRTYRIFDIDADPHIANFTPAHIQKLQNSGQNKVLSYLNIGSCEDFRSYWKSVPPGFVSCSDNQVAQLGRYAGYADEVWMNPGNAAYQKLIVEHVAPRLVAQGIDGFYFDNLEIVEHGTATTNGPCDAACSQGGLNLVAQLRNKYPNLLFVMQNATSDRTRLGVATSANGTVDFPSLLDGIAHEEVYKPTPDASAESELLKWAAMGLKPGGHPFWIGTLDYVGSCANQAEAQAAFRSSRARGFAPSVSDASASQQTVCYWPSNW